MSKGFASNYRIVLLATGVFLCFAGVATRLFFLHVIDRDRLVRVIDKARREISVEHSRRGDIFDARGDLLATSRTMIELQVDPQVLRPIDERKWPDLARLIDMPLPELEKIFGTRLRAPRPGDKSDADRRIQWAPLREEITESLYDQVAKLGIKGVYGTRLYRRTYPHGQLAAHVIGYVNKENVPATGVERYADFYLRGQDGWRESEKDGHQRELAQFRSRQVPAADGYSVVLSIDAVVQAWVEEELVELGKKFNPTRASIIVSDAHTGFILALANHPTFSLSEFNKASMEVQKNFTISDQIDPGSTFKIVPASAALNEGIVELGTRFDCTPTVVDYKGKPRRLMDDDHQWDHPLSVAEIVAHSSNHGAALLAMKLGEQRLYDYARAFGFGQYTGFPLVGEINGELTHPSKWDGLTITRMPAGYSISATPMQIHYAMAAIASGGELLKPQLIREISSPSGEKIYRFGSAIVRRVMTPATAQQMAVALQGVASPDGTAPNAAIPGYQVAGKTGTAQKLIDGRYSDRNHVGSFVGFLPASAPRIVISVIVDDGKLPTGRPAYGSTVAAPSFKRVAERLIPYLDIKPVGDARRAMLALERRHP